MPLTSRLARGLAAAALAGSLALGTATLATAAPVTLASRSGVAAAPAADHVDLAARAKAFAASRGVQLERPLERVIDPTQYSCDSDTDFDLWVDGQVAGWTKADLAFLDDTAADQLPALDAMIFGNTTDARFALDGTHARALRKTFGKLQSFWDIRSDDIQLMGMGSAIYQSVDAMQRVYEVAFGLEADSARAYAQLVHDHFASSTTLKATSPLMTLNAFAYSTFGQDPSIGDRIVMGEGILKAYDELGYGDVAPQIVLAHEFGHHVQFEIGMITAGTVDAPETTRRTELHADASASYFASHPKGLSMQFKRVHEFLGVFHGIGDCSFKSSGHHGTPAQRQRAGTWGYQVQEAERPKSYIHPSRTFAAMFDAKLPELVAPDA